MQNILRAEKKSIVKSVVAEAGAVLQLDQLIVEFEVPEQDAAEV